MNVERIFKQVIDSIYEEMPQSKQIDKIKAEALTFMIEEYGRWDEQGLECNESIALVIEHFGTEKKLRKALHYQINENNIVDEAKVGTYIKNIRMYSFLFSLAIGLFIAAIGVPAYYDYRIKLISAGVFFAGAVVVAYRFSRLKQYSYHKNYFDESAYHMIEASYNLYARKTLSAIILLIASIISVFGTALTAARFDGMSIWGKISLSNAWLIGIGTYLFANSLIKLLLTRNMYGTGNDKHFNDYLRKCLYWTFTYFILVWFVRFFCQLNRLDVPNSMFSISAVIYIFIFIFIFMLLRKNYLTKMVKIHRLKKILVCICVVGLLGYNILSTGTWVLQPYISTVATVAHETSQISIDDEGVYSLQMAKDEFNILQITDIHLGGSLLSSGKDNKALEAVYKLIENTKPDMVMVTGDFVFPLGIFSYSLDNYTPILQFATFMRNIGIPWAFVYGNHDTEVLATHTASQLNKMFSQFSYETSSSNLLYSQIQPQITGRSNQMIKLLNADGSLNQVLYLLDSNSYASNDFSDYDYIHDDQVEWYKNEVTKINNKYGRNVSSLMFFHIPIKAYQTAYDLYKAKSPEVTYYFGEVGEENESIGASKTDSKLFDTILELGSTKGIFVGHDHYNNISLGYKGVRLTYGMSIDYLAMPGIYNDTKQRGATLITVHNDSSFDVKQVRLTDIQ